MTVKEAGEDEEKSSDKVSFAYQGDSKVIKAGEGCFGITPVFSVGDPIFAEELRGVPHGGDVGTLQ